MNGEEYHFIYKKYSRYEDNRNVCIPSQKLIFFLIPKVGSTTIRNFVSELIKYNKSKELINIPYYQIQEMIKMRKAAFVRNPWDRLVSLYFGKIKRGLFSYFKGKNLDGSSFPNFVKSVCAIPDYNADRHFRSQFTMITAPNGELIVDFLGKFETFSKDIKHVLGNQIAIPHLNRSDSRHYADYYDEELKNLVAERYKIDIELFGFDFENTNSERDKYLREPIPLALKSQILEYKSMILFKEYSKLKSDFDKGDISISQVLKNRWKQ